MRKLIPLLLPILASALPAQQDTAGQTLTDLTLRVVDDATGKPIERYSILCYRVLWDNRRWIRGNANRRYDDVHRDGILLVEELLPGENQLLVLPEPGSGYVPSGYLPVQIKKEDNEVTVRLRRAMPFPVRVLDSNGKPVPGVRVQLLRKLGEDPHQWIVFPIRT